MQHQERRASESNRVKLETIVDICGNGIELQPFEAEAVDISGRGMHVRTAYLPPVGAPLVCRFQHEAREVLVEGVVAWRVEQARGGDFGVQFTAIDKDSVDVLRDLCSEVRADSEDAESQLEELPGRGMRVRLHIEGLGAPMKAAIRDASPRKLRVGSNLEFLRIGRQLELEAQESRARRSAQIDSVDVVTDPQTGVPQLMVTLRLRGGDGTPQPSVVDVPHKGTAVGADAGHGKGAADVEDAVRFEQEVVEEGERLHRRFREQFDELVGRAGSLFGSSVGRMAGAGGRGLGGGAGRLAKRAMAAVEGLRKSRRYSAKAPPRVTAPAPNGGFGQVRRRGIGTTRAQGPNAGGRDAAPRDAASTARPGGNVRRSAPVAPPRPLPKRKRLVALSVGGGAASLVFALVVRGMSGGQPTPPSAAQSATEGLAATESPVTTGRTLSDSQSPTIHAKNGIVAHVPLFGEVQMAPTEPVAPAAEGEDDGAAEDEAVPARPPTHQAKPLTAPVPDETWETAPAARVSPNEALAVRRGASSADPSTVAPWGRGKLHLPTVYELALSAPGAGLEGSVEATGFSVFVPDRTVSNETLSIARRDPRIVKVTTENTKDGARIRFRFRDAVPAYKVRLRNSKIQFLISAPE